jgi:hypothetical protein
MQCAKRHQKHGMRCDLWVQRLASLLFQEQVHHHQLSPMEEICQFCEAVKWKNETGNSCSHSRTVVLAPLHDPPEELKQLFKEDPLFLVKVRSYKSIFAFMSMGAWLTENAQIDEQLEDTQEACTCTVFNEHCVTCRYVATY